MESILYNQEGEKIGKVKLPDSIFNVPLNKDLVWQVATSQAANRRKPIAHTKDRGEVRGGGKKPWRQKGTGRARHGSIRSPLWVGGGITFGPRKEKEFKKKIPEKMKRKALFCVLSQKKKSGTLIVLDKINLKAPKTKEMSQIINRMREKIEGFDKGKTLIALSKKNENVKRASRNIPGIRITEAKDLNVLDILSFKYLILPKESIKIIEENFKIKK